MDDGLETVYGTADDGAVNVMSERVSGLAASIYREFERLIQYYDEDVVKELMPLVVNVLENLDGTVTENQEHEVELELLKDDNEQLITQYEREKQLRKQAEVKFLEYEDSNDQERRTIQSRLESAEMSQKQMSLKLKNYTDQISRNEYRESDMKKEYQKLQQRHNEVLHKYMEYVEKVKVQGQPQDTVGSPRIQIPRPHSPIFHDEPPTPTKESNNMGDSTPTSPVKDFTPSKGMSNDSNLQHEIMTSPDSDDLNRNIDRKEKKNTPNKTIETQATVTTSSVATGISPTKDNRNLPPEVAAIVDSTPELQGDDAKNRPDALPGLKGTHGKGSTIYDEVDPSFLAEMDGGHDITEFNLSEYGLTNTSSVLHALSNNAVDPSEFSGMGKEVENILMENQELRATKNALNIVKDDLIVKVDELTSETELLKQEINGLQTGKGRLQLRITDLEGELRKLKEENEKVTAIEDEEGIPMAQRKRFTRVEMARVLMERNQYKERLMELQEAVRWTEMIRATREHPSFEGKKNKSSIWKFFSNLFSTEQGARAPARRPLPPSGNVRYSAPAGNVKPTNQQRSQTIASLENKTKAFDFLDEGDANQRMKDKREQYKKVKAHVKKDDGRVQAYGWSLPAKQPSPGRSNKDKSDSKSGNMVGVPVPVFCRPLLEKEPGTKIWCAAGVNLSGGRTRDGGSIVGASVFYSSIGSDITENEYKKKSNSELDKLDEEITKQQREAGQSFRNQLSSLVWICTSDQNHSKVTVVDANQPQTLLDNFNVSDSYIICVASVPGAMESDYPSGEEQIIAETADDAASVSSTGSDNTFGNVTVVMASLATPRSGTPSSEKGDGGRPNEDSEFKAEVGDANVTTNIASVTDAEKALGDAAMATPTKDTVGMEGIVKENMLTRRDSTSSTDSEESGDPLGATTDRIPTEKIVGRQRPTENASDLLKDGLSEKPTEGDVMYDEADKMSSIKPTVWLGAQNGNLFVHSAVSQWRRCLHSIKLKDSILAIVHVKGRVLVALGDGTVAVFHRSADGQWDLSNYHLLDLGRPQHSIRCMIVVYDKIWCGLRNKVHVIHPQTLKVEKSFDSHPRRESQVRQLAWQGDGVWVSIRLDSTLRLYHAHTHQHLQDVDIEPYVSKMLGTGKLGFSFVRITSLMIACNRLWVGTGNGVIISIPLTEATKPTPTGGSRPGGVIRVYSDSKTDSVRAGSIIPYCSITQAQLSFHGHRDAVKFFVAVPGTAGGLTTTSTAVEGAIHQTPSDKLTTKNMLVLSGGEGYIDFRVGDGDDEEENAGSNYGDGLMNSTRITRSERSHLIVWQVTGTSD